MLLFKLWSIVLLLVVAFISLGTYELFKYLGWPPPKALPKTKAVQKPKKAIAQRFVLVEKERPSKSPASKIVILQLVIIASYLLLKGLDSVLSFILE